MLWYQTEWLDDLKPESPPPNIYDEAEFDELLSKSFADRALGIPEQPEIDNTPEREKGAEAETDDTGEQADSSEESAEERGNGGKIGLAAALGLGLVFVLRSMAAR